jgi:myo-inositol-1(or 4)-monophosphatase
MYISTQESLTIEKLVREVGELLRSYWPGREKSSENESLKVFTKSDGSKVTEADLAANERIVPELRRLFPADAIVSEEGPQDSHRVSASRVWILDPLDGTSAFIAGRDDFSILIGLSVDSEIVWGCMYFPIKGVYAVAGHGVGTIINGDRGCRVSQSPTPRPKSIYVRNCEIEASNLVYPEWMDSGMAFLSLARGDFDGMIMKMTTHSEWDLAAPAAVLLQNGGKMTDERGEPILFNQPKIGFRYLIASNGLVHDQLLEYVTRIDHPL